jgi:hypothetical protein
MQSEGEVKNLLTAQMNRLTIPHRLDMIESFVDLFLGSDKRALELSRSFCIPRLILVFIPPLNLVHLRLYLDLDLTSPSLALL